MQRERIVGEGSEWGSRRGQPRAGGGRRIAGSLICVLAVMSLNIPEATAATFPDLFVVTVEVDPAAGNFRAAGITRAMEVLLTRVTGNPDAAEYPELRSLIASADRLVTSYARLTGDRVRVGFNANAVQSELTALDWPIWGAERPQLALWVAVDFGAGQHVLLGAEQDDPSSADQALPADLDEFREGIVEELLQAADERGLPAALPALDAEDFGQMSFAGVWGGFDPLIMRASARYGADFALVARALLTDFGLDIDWTLIGTDGTSENLRSSTFREGIDWVANRFANQYVSVGGPRLTQIQVEGVSTLTDYGRVVNYLESVSIIDSVDVAAYDGDVLTLSAAIRANDTVLERVFELGGILEAANPGLSGPAFGSSQRFRVSRVLDAGQ